eukprot:scaffold1448_cov387-Prasinococcus_capsulatus_cf.AAC.11
MRLSCSALTTSCIRRGCCRGRESGSPGRLVVCPSPPALSTDFSKVATASTRPRLRSFRSSLSACSYLRARILSKSLLTYRDIRR